MPIVLRTPMLVISSPLAKAVVGFTPFEVSGQVTAQGYPEPVSIESVTVRVDSGPIIPAALKRIPNKKLIEVTFQANVQVTGGDDPHTVTVTVTSDAGDESKTVSVYAGIRAVPPAIVIDIEYDSSLITLNPGAPDIQSLVGVIQKGLLAFSGRIGFTDQRIVGPNLLLVPKSAGLSVLRVGFWLVAYDFPASELIQPSGPDFPLPTLTPAVAAAGFGLTPVLDLPPLRGVASYALAVPVTTIQLILNALKQTLIGKGITVNSVTAAVHPPAAADSSDGDLTVTFSGSKFDIGFTASVKETLGLAIAAPDDGSENVPAVLSTNTSTSVATVLQWIFSYLFIPFADLVLFAFWGLASSKVASAGDRAMGFLSSLLASLPPRIPFSNTSLALLGKLQPTYCFPAVDFNWSYFGATDSAITGSGIVELINRDQSTAEVKITGPTKISSYASGTDVPYQVILSGLNPKSEIKWQISGFDAGGPIQADSLTGAGNFTVEFPLTAKSKQGLFTIIVNAVETCGSDPTKTIASSGEIQVDVTLAENTP